MMSSLTGPVLVGADDYSSDRDFLSDLGSCCGFETIVCADAKTAIAQIDSCSADRSLAAVVTDLRMPGTKPNAKWGGWEVLSHAYGVCRNARLAARTNYYKHEMSEVFHSGAAIPSFTLYDKKTDNRKLELWLEDIRVAWDEGLALTLRDADTRQIYEQIAPIYARSSLPMLVLGETGVGKESLARRIHEASGRCGPFVPVSCGGLEPALAFSELFGHAQGAFTDARSHELGVVLRASGYQPGKNSSAGDYVSWLKTGNSDMALQDGYFASLGAKKNAGTLFLDEVATLSPKLMAGLLRVLSSNDVHPLGHHGPGIATYCRVVAATNEMDVLASAVGDSADARSRFRRDLCFRLAGAVLTLLPLRSRDPEDIRHYVQNVAWRQVDLPDLAIDGAALERIVDLYRVDSDTVARQYQKGNFRSLQYLVRRASLIATADGAESIAATHVNLAIQHGELKASLPDVLSNQQRIRETFRHSLDSHNVPIPDSFSLDELVSATKSHPIEVASALLACTLLKRKPRDAKQPYYFLKEIEPALLQGLSRSAWLNKTLTKDHVRSAALKHFGCTEADCPAGSEIQMIMKAVKKRKPDAPA